MDFEHMKKELDYLWWSPEAQKGLEHSPYSQLPHGNTGVNGSGKPRQKGWTDGRRNVSEESDVLTKTKPGRASLWRNNLKLQQKRGLLGIEIPLQDSEEKVDTVELLRQQLETQKCHYTGLTPTCRGIQMKSQKANSSFLAEHGWRNLEFGKTRKVNLVLNKCVQLL